MRLGAKLGLRLKAVQAISMAEPELARLIGRAEADSLFEKIKPFVSRLPFPQHRFHLPLDEQGVADRQAAGDIAWSDHEREMELIRRMGRELFERFFLLEDHESSSEEIASNCGITLEDVKRIQAFLFTLSLRSHELRLPVRGAAGRHYSCIAKVELSAGKPAVIWMLPHLAFGRYRIDYAGLRAFRPRLATDEKLRLRKLLGVLEAVNLRQNALWRAVDAVLSRQTAFLKSGRYADMEPLTAAALAGAVGVHPSTIGRLLEGRSLLMPWREELPMRSLLPNRKAVAVRAIQEVLAAGRDEPPDRELVRKLREDYRISASRRTVNEYRREALRLSDRGALQKKRSLIDPIIRA